MSTLRTGSLLCQDISGIEHFMIKDTEGSTNIEEFIPQEYYNNFYVRILEVHSVESLLRTTKIITLKIYFSD